MVDTAFQMIQLQGVLPMFGHASEEVSLRMLDAAYAGGARAVEFTNRSAQAQSVFRRLKKHAQNHLEGLMLGAGTIITEHDAEAFCDLGADFVVSPLVEPAVAAVCSKYGVMWCPGAATLTEMVHAQQMGAGLIKIFPAAQLGGAAFLRAIMAPCPWLRVMPTGGVGLTKDDLQLWFAAGARCVGIGSALFEVKDLEAGGFHIITERIRGSIEQIQNIRKNL